MLTFALKSEETPYGIVASQFHMKTFRIQNK